MSHQEKRNIFNIAITIILTLIYALIITAKYQNGAFDTTNLMRFWSIIILIYIPISIVGRIISMIIYRIVIEVTYEVKGENKDDLDIVDERDKLIELKSERLSAVIFGVGFITGLVTQVFNLEVTYFFIALVSGGLASDIISNVMQIIYHRKGI